MQSSRQILDSSVIRSLVVGWVCRLGSGAGFWLADFWFAHAGDLGYHSLPVEKTTYAPLAQGRGCGADAQQRR